MRIIPVLDLQGGVVVRGVAGERARYRPVESVLANSPEPHVVATALVDRFQFREAYVADLDAIAGAEPNWSAYTAIAAAGLQLIVDLGLTTVARAERLAEFAARERCLCGLVAGLESSPGPGELEQVFRRLGPLQAVFSLDLKGGQPLTTAASWHNLRPEAIADAAMTIGFTRLIVLDLARVGVGQGTGVEDLCRRLRSHHPAIELIAGGGVSSVADLQGLQAAGCDAALVASALHDGRLTNADVAAFAGASRRQYE